MGTSSKLLDSTDGALGEKNTHTKNAASLLQDVQNGQLPDGGSRAPHHARRLAHHGVPRKRARGRGEAQEESLQPGEDHVSEQQEGARPAPAQQQQHAVHDPLPDRERDQAHLQQLQPRERHAGR